MEHQFGRINLPTNKKPASPKINFYIGRYIRHERGITQIGDHK